MTQTQPTTARDETMTKDEFNSRRADIYRELVKEAYQVIKARGTCARGIMLATAKGIATKRFAKLEAKVYGI